MNTITKGMYALGRKIWRQGNGYLPQPVHRLALRSRAFILRKTQGLNLLTAQVDAGPSSGLAGGSNNTARQNARVPDHSATRPRLAFDYLKGLVEWLAESGYHIMSYNDLAGTLRFGGEEQEFNRWIAQAKKRGEKAILLQYDVDGLPQITHRLLDTHISLKVPANVMIFARRIYDWKLKQHGVLEYDRSYQLDFDKLAAFQKIGGVVGYHCNAFDRAGGDEDLALEIFHQDVAELRKHLNLRFMSMHGGLVTEDGRCNATLNVAPLLDQLGLTWVHNGRSINFHSTWSDGYASNPRYRNEASDPLDFILSTSEGQRTRLLCHPQYYNDVDNRLFDFPILADEKWVRRTKHEVESGRFDGGRYWKARFDAAQESINRFKRLFEPLPNESPVFVNGLSRSGTTLLVSMFDAHPQGAMAYESYPRYLHEASDDGVLTVEEYIYSYQCLMNYPDQVAFALLDRKPLRNLRKFAAVSSWTGMTTAETGELLRAYLTKYHRVAGPLEALEIVAASARFKVRAQGAKFWGTKCQGNFADYFALWPRARLVCVIRNGLDILASQQNTGSFDPDPERLGRQWRQQYCNFQAFQDANPQFRCAVVRYEDLVSTPEETTQRMCEQIGFDYHPQMIRQHEVETTLRKNPRGQLSVERVSQPIDRTSIDRWQSQLTDEAVSAFLKGCGGPATFETFGYEWTR